MRRELLPFELYVGSSCLTDSHIFTGSGSKSRCVRHPKLAVQPPKLDMRRKLAIFKLNLHSSCHSEDRSGISNCSRSAWTKHVMKAGQIDLDLRKDRLTIGRNLTSDRSESFVGPTSV